MVSIRDLSIKYKVLLVFCLIYAISISVGIFKIINENENLKSEFIFEKTTITKLAAIGCEDRYSETGFEGIRKFLETRCPIAGALQSSLTDSNNNIIIDYKVSPGISFVPTYQTETSHQFFEGILALHEPILVNGLQIGSLCLLFSSKELDEAIDENYTEHAVNIIILLLMGIVVQLIIIFIITNPIINLSGIISEATSTGNYNLKILSGKKDEIGALQTGFQKLLESINFQVANRQTALNELKISEENFRNISENISEGVAIEINGIFLWVNSVLADMIQIDRNEVIGKGIDLILNPIELDKFNEFKTEYFNNSTENLFFETKTITQNGNPVYLKIVVKNILFKNEQAIQYVFRDISARKQAEIEAVSNYMLFEQMFRQSNTAMFILDRLGSVLEINNRLLKMFGWDKKQIEYIKSYNILMDEKVSNELKDIIANAINIGVGFTKQEILQFDFLSKSVMFGNLGKSQIILNLDAYPIKSDGNVKFLIIQISDITEEVESKDRIISQMQELELLNEIVSAAGTAVSLEDLLQNLFDSINKRLGFESCGIYFIDESKRYADLKYFRELDDEFLSHFSHIDVAAKPFRITFMQKSLFFVDSANLKEAAKFKKWGFKAMASIPLLSNDTFYGSLCIATKNKEIFTDSDKRILATVGREMGIIVARIHAENTLRENEERYKSILYNSALGIYQTTLDGRLISINPAFARMFGYSSITEALTSIHNIEEQLFVDKDFRNKFINRVESENINNLLVETELFRRDSSFFLARINLRIARDSHGNIQYFEGFIEDVTERKRVEERLQAMNRELEKHVSERTIQLEAANKELEAFTYSVSHDLRAPLRAIDGFSHALLEDYGNMFDATASDYIRRVRAASQRMGTLIDDLLNLSRITRTDLVKENVSLSEISGIEADNLREMEPARKIEIQIKPEIFAECDRRLMTAVFQNLIGNSWKFTARQPNPRIEIGEEILKGERVFFVRDNGAGFDMTYADKLFGAFQRLHKMEEFEGTGVGLAIVKRIILKHGGKIWAEGKPNEGAKFSFTLG